MSETEGNVTKIQSNKKFHEKIHMQTVVSEITPLGAAFPRLLGVVAAGNLGPS
jgi:hypothetical protein